MNEYHGCLHRVVGSAQLRMRHLLMGHHNILPEKTHQNENEQNHQRVFKSTAFCHNHALFAQGRLAKTPQRQEDAKREQKNHHPHDHQHDGLDRG